MFYQIRNCHTNHWNSSLMEAVMMKGKKLWKVKVCQITHKNHWIRGNLHFVNILYLVFSHLLFLILWFLWLLDFFLNVVIALHIHVMLERLQNIKINSHWKIHCASKEVWKYIQKYLSSHVYLQFQTLKGLHVYVKTHKFIIELRYTLNFLFQRKIIIMSFVCSPVQTLPVA